MSAKFTITCLLACATTGLCLCCTGRAETHNRVSLTLDECVRRALLNNRDLQIERLNVPIARLTLQSGYGAYDPVFSTSLRRDEVADSGGFDPEDLSKDAIYEAQSHKTVMGINGFLPTGMSYSLNGSYANSEGTRNNLNFESYSLYTGASVSQPLLKNFWTDQNRLTLRINRHNLRITEMGVQFLSMSVVCLVHQAYTDLAHAREQLKIQEGLLQMKQQLQAAVTRKIELGAMNILDEKLAASQAARIETELIAAQNAVVLAENQLRTILGDPWTNATPAELVPVDVFLPAEEPPSQQESWNHGLAKRPDLQQLRVDVKKANLNQSYKRNQLFPSLDLVAGYGRKGASTSQVFPPASASASSSDAFRQIADGSAPNEMVGVVFALPLSRVSERAQYRASKELKAQAELRVKQKEELVKKEISDALQTTLLCRQRIDAARRACEHSRAALDAEQQKLNGGKSTVFFVLQLQSDLAEARSAESRARSEYLRALAQFHFAEGTTLERCGLSLVVE